MTPLTTIILAATAAMIAIHAFIGADWAVSLGAGAALSLAASGAIGRVCPYCGHKGQPRWANPACQACGRDRRAVAR